MTNEQSYHGSIRPHDAPEWLWYGTSNGQPVVTFGRWPKHGAVWRYKWAEIQPTEHDHPPSGLPKRPFAFAVKRAPDNGPDQWRLFMDEGEARDAAEQLDGDYEGLYRVGDRRSIIANREASYKRAWDAYVEFSMDPGKTTFDCVKAVVDAGCGDLAQGKPDRDKLATMLKANGFTSRDGTYLQGGTYGVIDAVLSALSSTASGSVVQGQPNLKQIEAAIDDHLGNIDATYEDSRRRCAQSILDLYAVPSTESK